MGTIATKAFGSNPSYQGVCERHGREDLHVTPGELSVSSEETNEVRDSISESEVKNEVQEVVGGRFSINQA